MWNLLVFAAIGVLAGAAARRFYPDRATPAPRSRPACSLPPLQAR